MPVKYVQIAIRIVPKVTIALPMCDFYSLWSPCLHISLTDTARSQIQEHIIFRWLSLKSTIEYLGEWEILYNPDF